MALVPASRCRGGPAHEDRDLSTAAGCETIVAVSAGPEVSALLRQGPSPPRGDAHRLTMLRELVLDRVFEDGAERSHIDRYRVLRHLGAGGMGSVWVAHDERLGREVAIKLLQDPPDDRTVARLVREAQALAALSHPNVVEVYGTGRSDDRVFIVMELVSGRSLAAWLRQPRPWPEVLEIMLQVARGLSAAHEAGIVHRDLKPSNVVVDDAGRARLIDFGLARLAEDTSGVEGSSVGPVEVPSSLTPLTRTGTVVGTPYYMAPEQFRGEASPASDQFSFCVTLYEALYGQRPFEGESYEVLQEVIGHGPRPLPVSDVEVPSALFRVLVRGLAVEPSQRWRSMAELSDRLERAARRGGRSVALALGGAAALVLGVGVALAWERSDPCDAVEDELATVWTAERRQDLERAAADGREPVAEVMGRWASGWEQAHTRACHEAAAIGATERGTAELACLRDAASELGARLEALESADGSRWPMSFDPSALPDLERCARGGTEAEPGDPQARELLARARGLRRADAYDEAEAMASRALERATLAGDAVGEAMARLLHGEVLLDHERFDEAEQELLSAHERARTLGEPVLELDAALAMMRVLGHRERYDDAGRWLRHAEAAWERGDRSPRDRVRIQRRRALLQEDLGDLDSAYELAQQVLEDASALGEPALVPSIQAELAAMARKRGELPVALEHYRKALEAEEVRLGPHHSSIAFMLSNYGATRRLVGQLDEARALQERALEIFTRAYGEHHTAVADVHINLGLVAGDQRDTARARYHYERALEILVDVHGGEDSKSAVVWVNLGTVEYFDGEIEAAMRANKRALAGYERDFGQGHPDTAPILANLGVLAFTRDELEDATDYLSRARSVLESSKTADPMRYAEVDANLGLVALERGDHHRAREQLRSARDAFAQAQGSGHRRVATVSHNLCVVELELRRYEAAAAECARAREIFGALPDPIGVANVAVSEARLALGQGRTGEGLGIYAEAIATLEAEQRSEHGDLYQPLIDYGRGLLGAGRAADAHEVLARAHAIAAQAGDAHQRRESGLWWARALWRQGQRTRAIEVFGEAAALTEADDAFAPVAARWRERPRTQPPLPKGWETAAP